MMRISVVSYGVYLPFLRIKRDEYLSALGSCSAEIKEKTVMDVDEDTITMAVEAARNATAGVDAGEIGVLTLASSNFPYQEKVMPGTIIEALGLNNNILTCQHSNSTLAGTEAFLSALGLLTQVKQKYALVVVSDAPTAGASLDMDHGFGAAACAFVLARDEQGLQFEGVYAHASESLGLRYRLPGETNVRDIGVKAYSTRAYNETVKASVWGLLNKLGRKPADYRHAVLHQNDVRTTVALAKKMGFSEEQINEGLIYSQVGDTGACSALLGLCHVLDKAVPGDRILVCSYGAGAGSHALSFKLNNQLPGRSKSFQALLNEKKYISYIHYLKLKKSI
ncbi:3-Oxoacyl-(acyl-carrier-protein (ACP)) synthase III domain-containing protein [Desulfofundulus kuznetsovii DSM 6115]|uniref:3-Oxoacyl-(Acyl-carrier-protein (ACP)) synthase III domain-containing protein n=1 Tax=Desulfofundulus kuznetsovii (strain DSM 6115 / VKM B-1805 / 17) TaxID=760568 RepID=A0AAU8P8A9_DESK7|nr:3-Oxoacyl-(acyl-carrier-protein (ACP)) synthase III domain-containing protein [Desulfofundulus kuznetsovii DSM 6115]